MTTLKEENKIINNNKRAEKVHNILRLKAEKYTQTQVAEILNIGFRTVQRYWNKNIDDYKIIDTSNFKESHLKGNHRETPQYKVNRELDKYIGVYKITLDNQIYIGSTVNGFRKRFIQHTHETNKLPETKNLLDNGGIFEILWIAENKETEPMIRQMENYYINYYKDNTKLEVVNNSEAWSLTEKKPKFKYKSIKIREDKFQSALQLLKENNLIP